MSKQTQQTNMEAHAELRRDKYRIAVKWLVIMSVITVVLSAILTSMFVFKVNEKANYYASTTTGYVIPLHPLSEPVVTQQYLLQWAELATRKAYNLDFINYQKQLQGAKAYFTPGGWNQFNAALKKASLLDTVIDKKLNMSAVVSGTPVILAKAVVHGRFTWRIQLPILVTFVSASSHSQSQVLVTMNIQRIPTLDAAKGIQISSFDASS